MTSSPAHVRVRFAPSPTGTLHLGSARSALYNWLYARHIGAGATYVLRIEDTDPARSTPENVDQALRVFRWLGLDWDEGPGVGGPHMPYHQSARAAFYRRDLEELLARHGSGADHGFAYRCFCTQEQLDADRAAAEADKRPYVYSGRCRSLAANEGERRAADGDAYVVRFAVPTSGSTTVHDLVLGDASFEHALLGDFVIARGDGSPLYNFANVVDDAEMEITHVIRGNDHLSNTPRQILLYEALGQTVPAFAHLPMVLGPDGAKLSKRRHHTSTIEQLAASGYAPAAVCNGLALVGWSKDDVTTVMTKAELIEAFDVARVKKAPASIDYQKLEHINGEHLRAMSAEEWGAGYEGWREDWLDDALALFVAAAQEAGEPVGADVLDRRRRAAHALSGVEAAALVQEKCATWNEVPDYLAFLVDPFEMSGEAEARLAKTGELGARVLEHVVTVLEGLGDFELATLEAALRGACEALELKPGKVFSPVRFAATGRTIAPGLWESLHVLGRDRALERLRAGRDRLAAALPTGA